MINTLNNLRHINLLLDGVVDFCTFETKGIKIKPAPVNLEEAIMYICDLYHITCEAKSIKHTIEIDKNLTADGGVIWNTDIKKFSVVFAMIYHNAIKFCDSGEITIKLLCDETVPNLICVKIIDTGIGIENGQ